MIVFFISESRGKSHKKVRRVLDSFADRIGQDTWKTVITQKGLESILFLLKEIATKDTSVVCHLLKGRKKTEILWIVGRNFYINDGIIPVNYTTKDVPMDEIKKIIDSPLANTAKQNLFEHLYAIAYISQKITFKLTGDERLAKAAFISGLLHDIGKVDPQFQNWVKKSKDPVDLDTGAHIQSPVKFSFEKYPRHNEISFLFLEYISNIHNYLGNRELLDIVKHSVFWHHAKPIRRKEFSTLEDIYEPFSKTVNVFNLFQEALEYINDIQDNVSLEITNDIDLDKMLPKYKRYRLSDDIDDYVDQTLINAKANIVRSILVSSDKKISSLDSNILSELIKRKKLDELVIDILHIEDSSLLNNIQKSLDGFNNAFPGSQRNIDQSAISKELFSEENVVVLSGPAGSGKTKVSLEWALNNDSKKILFICPRVQVCQGLYNDLTSKEYLFDSTIEIFTGDFKKIKKEGIEKETQNYFNGDVILTTIDQIINSVTTHNKIDSFFDFLKYTVIFDEYHEYVYQPGFNIFLMELIKSKQLLLDSKTLLISATPNPFFTKNLLEIDSVLKLNNFNKNLFKIEFNYETENSSIINNVVSNKKQTIFIYNTAIDAQKRYLNNESKENGILFHSKYTSKDKVLVFNNVFDSFKKNGSKKYNILRASPIIQASLNISCEEMITDITSPDNLTQRLGRLDRFGDNNDISKLIISIPEFFTSGKDKKSKFLKMMNIYNTSIGWYDYLQTNLNLEEFTLDEYYDVYASFFESDTFYDYIEEDILNSLKKGVENINSNIFDPLFYPKREKKSNLKIKSNSLRGNNRFVNMAICKIEDSKVSFLDEYLNEPITLETKIIQGYGDSSRSSLNFMMKSHQVIDRFKFKKPYNDSILLNMARSPESPIYLSYTDNDLKVMNRKKEDFFYFYVFSKENVGIMSYKQIMEIKK